MSSISDPRPPALTANFPELPFAEQLLLWGVRMWVRAFKERENAQDILRHGFELSGIRDAYPAIDDLMTVIAASTTASIDIRCPGCKGISLDEHRIMAVVAATQAAPGWMG